MLLAVIIAEAFIIAVSIHCCKHSFLQASLLLAVIIAWRSLVLNILIYIDHDSKCNQANIFCIGGFLMLIVVGAYDVIIYDVIYLTSSCNSSFDIEFKLFLGWTRFIYNNFNININKYILYQNNEFNKFGPVFMALWAFQ